MKRLSSVWALYQLTEVDDEAGGTTETEEYVKAVHLDVSPLQGSRADQYSQIIDGKPFVIKMRYTKELTVSGGESDELTKNFFFLKDGRRLFIHAITNMNEDNRYLNIIAWEKA